jgi:hypothetical protein
MRIFCPTCDRDYLTVYSRKRYLIKASVCFTILLLFYFLFDKWGTEDIELWNASSGLLMLACIWGGLLVCCLSIIGGIFYIIKGVSKKKTTYKCGYCKSEYLATSLIQDHDATMNALLKTLRKPETV